MSENRQEVGQEKAKDNNVNVITAIIGTILQFYHLVLGQGKEILAITKDGRVFEFSGRKFKNHFEDVWFQSFKALLDNKIFPQAYMTIRQKVIAEARQVTLVNGNYHRDESGAYFRNEGGFQVRTNEKGVTEVNVVDSRIVFTGDKRSFVKFGAAVANFMSILKETVRLADGQLILFIGCLLKAFLPGPNPVMILVGEQGSGKTFLAKLFQMIVDPADTGERVRIIDNISGIGDRLSDELCRESHQRVIIVTTICDLMPNQDLVDRTILFTMKPIPNSERKTEAELRTSFKANLGGIMYVIALALSEVAKNFNKIKKSYPRLADFTHVCTAAASSCESLGFNDGEFMTALVDNRVNAIERSLNDNPVSAAIIDFMDKLEEGSWSGTATELLAMLKEDAPGDVTGNSNWPSKPNKLSGMVRRATPFLRAKGLDVEWGKSGQRSISIVKIPASQGESYQTDLFIDHGLGLEGGADKCEVEDTGMDTGVDVESEPKSLWERSAARNGNKSSDTGSDNARA